LEQEIRKG
jgi:hypothetical protein